MRCCTVLLLVAAIAPRLASAAPEDDVTEARRAAAIADFSEKTRAANYPALFDAAAREFRVPADILKGIAFAETRWEHLQWPPGEVASPENGMPRPFGIMSLWDNPYFGHSLLEAAALIGRQPDELKRDAFQNIRGAAALLRKLYDENPKPPGGGEDELESWRYAVRKYCGIPEPDLNAQHALKVYMFIAQGFHQYGIEWEAHPVNLEPIREETRRIALEEQARREAIRRSSAAVAGDGSSPAPKSPSEAPGPEATAVLRAPEPRTTPAVPLTRQGRFGRFAKFRPALGLLTLAALVALLWFLFTEKQP